MTETWLNPEEWRLVQRQVPIACVDVLPIRPAPPSDGSDFDVGLIYRETPHEGQRWCLIGGRLLRNESLCEAVSRQLRETLGQDIEFTVPQDIQPLYVTQYFSERRAFGGVDPRQHAIGLIFAFPIAGVLRESGEAISFRWFHPSKLPAAEEIGFDQHDVLLKCIARLKLSSPSQAESIHGASRRRRTRSKIS